MRILILSCACLLFSCRQHADNSAQMQSQIHDLQKQLAETYKPGFGELMSSIQVHHNKLYFAGENKNWELADFEIHEIMEALDDLPKFCSDRKEIKSLPMILPAIDSVSNAIKQKNASLFKSSFKVLTRTCNNCHQATNFGFNVVKIPENPPFSNQDFKVNDSK